MDELFEDKTKIVLNLIRSNNKADEALKLTQALVNIGNAQAIRKQLYGKTVQPKGAGA